MFRKVRAGEAAFTLLPLAVIVATVLLLAAVPRSQLVSGGSIAPQTPWLRIADNVRLDRIAFGSCVDQKRPAPIWDAIVAARPQVFLMMGDMVYGDVRDLTDPAIPELRSAYRMQAQQPELARARAAFPFLAIWDDHDFGLNDAGADFPLKAATLAAYREFWQISEPQLHEGLYYSRILGPPGRRVQVIVLDTRWFRSPLTRKPALERVLSRGPYAPDASEAKTMLGAAQWAWLEEELKRPAEIRLLVSSIQVHANAHGFERWGNFPRERERLYEALKRSAAKGLIVLSGDRHWAAIYRKSDILAYPLVEVTASALNQRVPSTDPPEPERISEPYNAPNFGLMDIDWAGRMVKITVRGVDGETALSLDMPFAQLGL